ncbi:MAG: hypothetical protein E7393_06135 [Ruminococcaceae bacterium]|nr:hypothetical protein [Oscillospiraceae bacterium]
MSTRKKTMLMMFADYAECLIWQLLGLFILSWMLKFSWGDAAYSLIFCIVFFSHIYSRAHRAAKRDSHYKDLRRTPAEGLLLATPLAVFNLLLIVIFALIQKNIIPIRNIVITTTYSFPDNEPRIATDILLIDYLSIFVRFWFGMLAGFIKEKLSWSLLLLVPLLTALGGFLGYFAGRKKYYFSETLVKTITKVKDKFNE